MRALALAALAVALVLGVAAEARLLEKQNLGGDGGFSGGGGFGGGVGLVEAAARVVGLVEDLAMVEVLAVGLGVVKVAV